MSTEPRPDLHVTMDPEGTAWRSCWEFQFFYNVALQLLFGPTYPLVAHHRYDIPAEKMPLPHRQNRLFDLTYDLQKRGALEFDPIRSRHKQG